MEIYVSIKTQIYFIRHLLDPETKTDICFAK